MEKTKANLELISRYFSDFTEQQLQQFAALDALYREWNGKINVISRKDIDSLYEKHILHSLAIAAAFDFEPGMRVLDIGTGGGFPGIPMAIFFPEVKFHLVDSIGKKINVVEAVTTGAGLKNIHAFHKRAEEMDKNRYDVVVSRAVAPLKELWKWSKPLLVKKNRFVPDSDKKVIPHGLICLKGGELAAEISESGTRPRIMEIAELFQEAYFQEKYILYVSGSG